MKITKDGFYIFHDMRLGALKAKYSLKFLDGNRRKILFNAFKVFALDKN